METTTINTPCIKDTAKIQEIPVKTTPSTDNNRVLPPCIADNRGHCVQHSIMMSKSGVSSKKWCDRGKGREFGWKTTLTTKYICKSRLSSLNNTPNMDQKVGGSVINGYQQFEEKGGSEKGVTYLTD